MLEGCRTVELKKPGGGSHILGGTGRNSGGLKPAPARPLTHLSPQCQRLLQLQRAPPAVQHASPYPAKEHARPRASSATARPNLPVSLPVPVPPTASSTLHAALSSASRTLRLTSPQHQPWAISLIFWTIPLRSCPLSVFLFLL